MPKRACALALICLVLALVAGLAAACRDAAIERLGLAAADPISVMFIVHGAPDDPLWAEVRTGAEDAAGAFGVSTLWAGEPDPALRAQQVRDAIQQGFDVIVLTLAEPDALRDAVEEAIRRDVDVYVINVGADSAAAWGATFYFGQNENVAGLAAGDRLLEAGASHLLCVQHELDNAALKIRCDRAGFRVGQVTILQLALEAPDAQAQLERALRSDPSIDAVLTLNVKMLSPAAAAIVSLKPDGRTVLHAAFDVDEPVLDAIEAGSLLFAVDQQPYLQGYLPVAYARLSEVQNRSADDDLLDAMLQWIAGGGIQLGPNFVDATNVERVRSARPGQS